jgi:hypothetical protein
VADEYTSVHWMLRAQEALAIARHLEDPDCKLVMFTIGAGYEQLAKIADRRQSYESAAPPVEKSS